MAQRKQGYLFAARQIQNLERSAKHWVFIKYFKNRGCWTALHQTWHKNIKISTLRISTDLYRATPTDLFSKSCMSIVMENAALTYPGRYTNGWLLAQSAILVNTKTTSSNNSVSIRAHPCPSMALIECGLARCQLVFENSLACHRSYQQPGIVSRLGMRPRINLLYSDCDWLACNRLSISAF